MGIFDEFYEKAKKLFAGDVEALKKRDYYELLEVDCRATADEIKKSYRKLALKWHPDKNQGREEECAAYFTLLQQAYEVLSDPRERAFYDKHKDNILRERNATEEQRDEGLKLFQYFQPCFKGFNDDPEGFYSVYRTVFDTLATEEFPYIEENERDFPSFGRADSDYESVVGPFYDFWTSFSTSRSFAWLDKWELRDAPDRFTLRAMEKENKKAREAGRTERNEEIRSLANFVRKRDKRMKAYRELLEERKQQAQLKAQEQRKQRIRQNWEEMEAHVEDEEHAEQHRQALEAIESQLDAEFGSIKVSGDSDNEANETGFFCIVCEKAFKNVKSYANHQQSKKHKTALEELRRHMKEEDALLLQADIDEVTGTDAIPEKKLPKSKRKGKGKAVPEPVIEEAAQLDEPSGAENGEVVNEEVPTPQNADVCAEAPKKSKKQKANPKSKQQQNTHVASTDPVPSVCKVCDEEFSSRSKLFRHIEVTGHAALKDTANVEQKSGKNKKKNRK